MLGTVRRIAGGNRNGIFVDELFHGRSFTIYARYRHIVPMVGGTRVLGPMVQKR